MEKVQLQWKKWTNCSNNLVTPIDFYSLFFTDELLQKIADETNRHAEQSIVKRIMDESVKYYARIAEWKDVDVRELKLFWNNNVVRTRPEVFRSEILRVKIHCTKAKLPLVQEL